MKDSLVVGKVEPYTHMLIQLRNSPHTIFVPMVEERHDEIKRMARDGEWIDVEVIDGEMKASHSINPREIAFIKSIQQSEAQSIIDQQQAMRAAQRAAGAGIAGAPVGGRPWR